MSSLEQLKNRLSELDALGNAIGMMDYDQQVFMPPGGAEPRAEHVSILSRMHHELFVGPEVGQWIEAAKKEVAEGSEDAAMLRVVGRNYQFETKLPTELVERRSKLSAQGHELWVEARKNNDFGKFAPVLEQMVQIARETADYFGFEDHPYDALIDSYEEGMSKAKCQAMFDSIRERTVALVEKAATQSDSVRTDFLTGDWPEDKQREFTEFIVREVGFDFHRGRQDTAPHPFCSGFSRNDIRLTTRFLPLINSAIFGSLHEAGHGMYEQGSPNEWDRTPLAGGVSLGLHESQSRLWENIVGRSRPFWERYLPELRQRFPEFDAIDVDTFWRGVNKVEPSLIRVEADEVTYNLHIMVRFETECALVEGSLAIKDLPDYWNAKYKEYLGIDVPNDANGCLQDVHWSMGSIGYFPTYTMGNLLSYQIWNRLRADLGDTDALIREGKFQPILEWLIDKIYSQGKKYQPQVLVERVTGEPMNAKYLLDALETKVSAIYGE